MSILFILRVEYPGDCDVSVIPAKLVPESDRGAGIQVPDKPCGLSGMTSGDVPLLVVAQQRSRQLRGGAWFIDVSGATGLRVGLHSTLAKKARKTAEGAKTCSGK